MTGSPIPPRTADAASVWRATSGTSRTPSTRFWTAARVRLPPVTTKLRVLAAALLAVVLILLSVPLHGSAAVIPPTGRAAVANAETAIFGTVSALWDLDGEIPLSGALVTLFVSFDGVDYSVADTATTNSQGEFTFTDLDAEATYVVRARDLSSLQRGTEYWSGSHAGNARYFAQALPIDLNPGETYEVRIQLGQNQYDVYRLAGPGRFETNVSITQWVFSNGSTPVVYVANGRNYPDALTAGPAATVQGGALLLVESDGIPAVIAEELERLEPDRIVVVGGEASVDADVFAQLSAYAPQLDRIGGADRYETSRLVVADAFAAAGSEMAFIATGQNFPDALAAGPAAGLNDAPVILVDGNGTTLDPETGQLLEELGVASAYIAGGTSTVSQSIENAIRTTMNGYLDNPAFVKRFPGTDRFDTADRINQEFFAHPDFALLANAYNFPDALAVGPVAGALKSPLYLSIQACIPMPVLDDIFDLDPPGVILLGGEAALSSRISNLGPCLDA